MKLFARWAEKIRGAFSRVGYTCDLCDGEIFEYPNRRLCYACESEIVKNDGLRCGKCGRKTVAEGICMDCKRRLPRFTHGISPLVYADGCSSLINKLKNGKRHLAWYLGEKMSEALLSQYPPQTLASLSENGKEPPLLLPVPMTAEKKSARGYNQAEELAYALRESLRRRGVDSSVDTEILVKRKETEEQKELGGEGRIKNVSGAYHVHKRSVCNGKTLLLVDDIMTTGATGSECAERLLGAGAKAVIFLVAASLAEQKNGL